MSDIAKDKIYQFIDDYYRHAFERPQMYFSCPDSVEDLVFILECLRAQVADDFKNQICSNYIEYCISKGLGSARFITRFREARPEGFTDEEYYQAYGEFLSEYVKLYGKHTEAGKYDGDSIELT